jgi:p-hydroxybenzoate 3-monooxygenase
VTEISTQVAIVGGGPAGTLLAQLLDLQGIESVVIEQRSAAYVLERIRAGVVEHGSAEVLRAAGVGARMDREGFVHDGTTISIDRTAYHLDFHDLIGRTVMVYGQTELTKDLYDERARRGSPVLDDCDDVALHNITSDTPSVTFARHGTAHTVRARWIAGCDGYHGASRAAFPSDVLRTYELVYPFGWLGILSETPPVHHELIYASHPDGFALCSMRNPMLSRYYVQCATDERVEEWSDDRFWDTLRSRLPEDAAQRLVTGPSIEKSIAPLRSFVAEPLRHGSLFLAGDAAHIVPPTGAKGLNLAISDVQYLAAAMAAHHSNGSTTGLDEYSARALSRVWKAVRFSWWMTMLMHRFPDDDGTIRPHLQRAELDELGRSRAAQMVFAENYTGLPYS